MVGGAYAGGSVLSAGVGACASGVGCVLQSIIRNTFGYIAISVELNRRASFCGVAEKWLKRNKSISGILCEGRSEIGERAEDREIGFFTIGQGCVGVAVRRFYMVTRLYPLNKQRKRLLICYSRKMAKTELYNER